MTAGPQTNALAAITAALTANQPAAAAPVQQTAFVFQPQVPAPAAAAPVQANPFQPSPQQAQTAFVAAVPQAAQTHAHPSTGVVFQPINPPGEAVAPPTVGLDAAPAQGMPTLQSVAELVGPFVQAAPPDPNAPPAPKARTRKPRAPSGGVAEMTAIAASVAGGGAVQPVEASASPLQPPTEETTLAYAIAYVRDLLPAGTSVRIRSRA